MNSSATEPKAFIIRCRRKEKLCIAYFIFHTDAKSRQDSTNAVQRIVFLAGRAVRLRRYRCYMSVSYDIYSSIKVFQVHLSNKAFERAKCQCYHSKLLLTPTMMMRQHRERVAFQESLVLSQAGFLWTCWIHLVGYVQNKSLLYLKVILNDLD